MLQGVGWGVNYCRSQKIAPKVRKLFLNLRFTLGEEPPLTLGEELQTARSRLAGWLAGKPDYPQKLKVPEGYEKAVSKPITNKE